MFQVPANIAFSEAHLDGNMYYISLGRDLSMAESNAFRAVYRKSISLGQLIMSPVCANKESKHQQIETTLISAPVMWAAFAIVIAHRQLRGKRVCEFNEIEDESHFLFKCSLYD